ncbi:hypothetical protein ABEB36_007440 [Hypothenemus hampei]|uniref:N-acetyltransferase domain-containing protein n=1 Tax=Hypothenemus hampei TaxID=57062 RepID=A0ABD1EX29_HYPHA
MMAEKDDDQDILSELNNTELKELADIYWNYKNELPHIYNFLQCCIKSKGINMEDYVSVFSPGNCWREDGTFIASMPSFGHDIVLHSLDKTGKNLVDGLLRTNRFKFHPNPERKYTFFYAVHEHFFPTVLDIVTRVFKRKTLFVDTLNLWHLKKEEAEKLQITPPQEVYVKELQSTDISVIVEKWLYSYPTADHKIRQWITLQKGFGVYLKANNEMVSWAPSSCLGQITALQTNEEHMGKGYASMLVKTMAKYLAKEGLDTCAFVLSGNIASERVFEKLNFNILCKCHFIAVSHDEVNC